MLVVAAAFASAADARQAHRMPISGRGDGYDGYWNGLIITDAGTCDRTCSLPVHIAGGHVLSGGMAEVAGSVPRSGDPSLADPSFGSDDECPFAYFIFGFSRESAKPLRAQVPGTLGRS